VFSLLYLLSVFSPLRRKGLRMPKGDLPKGDVYTRQKRCRQHTGDLIQALMPPPTLPLFLRMCLSLISQNAMCLSLLSLKSEWHLSVSPLSVYHLSVSRVCVCVSSACVRGIAI